LTESKGSPRKETPIRSLVTTFRQKKGRSFIEYKRDITTPQELIPNNYSVENNNTTKCTTKLQRIISQAITLKHSSKNIAFSGVSNTPATQDSARNNNNDDESVIPVQTQKIMTEMPSISARKKSASVLRRSSNYVLYNMEHNRRGSNRSLSNTKGMPLEYANYYAQGKNKTKDLILTDRCSNANQQENTENSSSKGCRLPTAFRKNLKGSVSSLSTLRKRRYAKESNKENSKSSHTNNMICSGTPQQEVNQIDYKDNNNNEIQLPYMTLKTLAGCKDSRADSNLSDLEKKIAKSISLLETANLKPKVISKNIGSDTKEKSRRRSRLGKLTNKTVLAQTVEKLYEEIQVNFYENIDNLYSEFNVRREEQLMLVPKLANNMQWIMTNKFAIRNNGFFQIFEPELEIFESLLNKKY